jgi:hypothetical protein
MATSAEGPLKQASHLDRTVLGTWKHLSVMCILLSLTLGLEVGRVGVRGRVGT